MDGGFFKQDLEYSVAHGLYKFHSNVHEDNGGSDLLPILITSASGSVIYSMMFFVFLESSTSICNGVYCSIFM